MEEFELKFLDIDVPTLEAKLHAIGATKIAEYFYRIALFDYPDWRLNEKHSWVRLRTDGTETTISYKERLGVKSEKGMSDDGMKEIEFIVEEYDKAYTFFKSIGFLIKREEEKKRIRYVKESVVFDIDFWPEIPPCVEVEGISMDEVNVAARELGFDPTKGMICSAKQIYAKYGINLDEYHLITFGGLHKK